MYLAFKRFCEVILSLLALIILSPILVITALAVKLDSPTTAYILGINEIRKIIEFK